VKEKYKIKGDYLLFLSTLKPSKNVEGIVEAYKLLKDKGVKDTLVIGGKKGWLFDSIYEKVKVLRLESEILFTDFIDEEDKAPMILGSKALISPSHWEGFGMHVVESLACGTPVIVSRVASLPEVVGDAGIYVDNNDVSDIAAGMEELLGLNPKEYNKLVGKGLKQVRKYSWNKAAKETLGVFEKAVS
jgi:glycosyltransferase involved in cell wall biosynthesis